MDNSYDLVGEIPTALLLGWQRRPQGRDWTSILEAGLNGVKALTTIQEWDF